MGVHLDKWYKPLYIDVQLGNMAEIWSNFYYRMTYLYVRPSIRTFVRLSRQAAIQAGKQTDRQTDRHTGRKAFQQLYDIAGH